MILIPEYMSTSWSSSINFTKERIHVLQNRRCSILLNILPFIKHIGNGLVNIIQLRFNSKCRWFVDPLISSWSATSDQEPRRPPVILQPDKEQIKKFIKDQTTTTLAGNVQEQIERSLSQFTFTLQLAVVTQVPFLYSYGCRYLKNQ